MVAAVLALRLGRVADRRRGAVAAGVVAAARLDRDARGGLRLQRYRRCRSRPAGRAHRQPPGRERAGQREGGMGVALRAVRIGLVVLFQLRFEAQLVALGSLGLVAAYPFMKRITWWPQAWLGLVFTWGAPVGWVALRGDRLDVLAALYAGSILWCIGYDTIYALQDREDDCAGRDQVIGVAPRRRHVRGGVAGVLCRRGRAVGPRDLAARARSAGLACPCARRDPFQHGKC